MLVIRLQRAGRKGRPFYRVVVAEKHRPVKGRFIEKVGFYNPFSKEFSVNSDRVKYWISVGAIPSDTLASLLVKHSIKEAEKFIKKRVQKPKKEAEEDSSKEGK